MGTEGQGAPCRAEAEAAGAIADLRQETQKLSAAVGPDPMPAILQAAAAAELVPGATYQAAVQDAANPTISGAIHLSPIPDGPSIVEHISLC